MQAIILAAGLSKRLRPLTDSVPKCLLKIGDRTILEMTINNLLRNNIDKIIIVSGYRENMIKEYIVKKYASLDVTFLTNRDYENNNNSYSLWVTKNHITDDALLLDSDILFDYRIISKLLATEYPNCLAVNTRQKLGKEEIKVIIDSTNKIRHIGKDLNPEICFGESIGIEKFSKDYFSKLGEVLERKIIGENNVNEFYENSFQELINGGNDIYTVDVSEYESMEIDTPKDLRKAQNIFKN